MDLNEKIKSIVEATIKEENKNLEGSFLDIASKVHRYLTEASVAIIVAKKEFAHMMETQSYKASGQVQEIADLVEKSIVAANKVIQHAITNIKKLGG